MNKYTLYIGANNETGAVEVDAVQEILNMHFDGYNMVMSTGVWNGKTEQSMNVTIFTVKERNEINGVVRVLCGVLKQQCIMIGYTMDCAMDAVTKDCQHDGHYQAGFKCQDCGELK